MSSMPTIPLNLDSSTRRGTTHSLPRYASPEFFVYYVSAAFVIPTMAYIPITLSSPQHPNYPLYQSKLSDGWLFGQKIDNSDPQYRSFRNSIPSLLALAAAHLISKHIYIRCRPATQELSLIPYILTFSIVVILLLHGISALKIILILYLNYLLAKLCGGSKMGPALTWVFNGLVLFANEWSSGYRLGSLHTSLGRLDLFEGLYPRWHILFNITMLRLVSFNMDYYWACKPTWSGETGIAMSEKQRKAVAHSLHFYSFENYLSYALYPPLYIGGPIITYNDFLWQIRRPPQLEPKSVLLYFLRFIACFLTMEFILHYMYVVAIKDTRAWYGYTPAELNMVGFWNLTIVWLKLLIPWRFFRLWAFVDGIDPPENMIRCIANNYSTFGFWRSWHRSYNLWIVRYIYIPLGGSKRVVINTALIFTFVALWHDLSFKLLAWGWLVSVFIVPELLARYFLPASKYEAKPWYRHVCAAGAVVNILMMMSANLVGFVIGLDGVSHLFGELFGSWEGLRFLAVACVCLFIGAQLMFECREEEMRRGIYRKC